MHGSIVDCIGNSIELRSISDKYRRLPFGSTWDPLPGIHALYSSLTNDGGRMQDTETASVRLDYSERTKVICKGRKERINRR